MALLTMVCTGSRIGEVRVLNWPDLDLVHDWPLIKKDKQLDRQGNVVATKTKDIRDIRPIFPGFVKQALRPDFRTIFREKALEIYALSPTKEGFILDAGAGVPYDDKMIKKHISKAIEKAGVSQETQAAFRIDLHYWRAWFIDALRSHPPGPGRRIQRPQIIGGQGEVHRARS